MKYEAVRWWALSNDRHTTGAQSYDLCVDLRRHMGAQGTIFTMLAEGRGSEHQTEPRHLQRQGQTVLAPCCVLSVKHRYLKSLLGGSQSNVNKEGWCCCIVSGLEHVMCLTPK